MPHSILYYYTPGYYNRTDTVCLVRKSFINLTIHKSASYLTLDSIELRVAVDYCSAACYSAANRTILRDKSDASDKIIILYSWYQSPSFTKLYFQWDIIRNGAVLSTQADSTAMVQFGTKNFTVNN